MVGSVMAPITRKCRGRRSRCSLLPLAVLMGFACYAISAGTGVRCNTITSTKSGFERIVRGDLGADAVGHAKRAESTGLAIKAIIAIVLIAVSAAKQVRSNGVLARPPVAGHGDEHAQRDRPGFTNHAFVGLLGVCALASMVFANLDSTAAGWASFWSAYLGPEVGGHAFTIKGWFDEGLMVLFFFNTGLVFKCEFTDGALATRSKDVLPCIAAVGGMVVPLCACFFINQMVPGDSSDGTTAAEATDIAFAVGVVSLYKHSLHVYSPVVRALATADQLVATSIIAIVFVGIMNSIYLVLAAATLLAAWFLDKRSISLAVRFFMVPSVAFWYYMLRGGLKVCVAGVLVALCVHMSCSVGHQFAERFAHRWKPVLSWVILPISALANCAVGIRSGGGGGGSTGIPYAVALCFAVSNPLGICSFTWLACRFRLAQVPKGTRNHRIAAGMLGSFWNVMCLLLFGGSITAQLSSINTFVVLAACVTTAALNGILMSCLPAAKEPFLTNAHGTPTVAAFPSGIRTPVDAVDDHCEFELMVETPMENEWCITWTSPAPSLASSTTGTVKRGWEEFHSLPKAHKQWKAAKAPSMTAAQAAQMLGLSTPSELRCPDRIRAAFKQKLLTAHPDKGGSEPELAAAQVAYDTLCKQLV